MPHPNRKAGGAKATRAGKQFENELEALHAQWEKRGLLISDTHNQPTAPFVRKGQTGPPLRRSTGEAPYDFGGALGPASPFPGRMFALEAKAVAKRAASLAIKNVNKKTGKEQGSGVGRSQLRRLVELHAFGAIVALVWRNDGDVGVLTPPRVLAVNRLVQSGAITRIPRDRFYWLDRGSLDWLTPILERPNPLPNPEQDTPAEESGK